MSNAEIPVVIKGDNSYHGTLLYLDGHEVPSLTNVTFSHPARGVAKVTAEVLVMDGFEIEVVAGVEVRLLVRDGTQLTSEPLADGGTRYTAVRVDPVRLKICRDEIHKKPQDCGEHGMVERVGLGPLRVQTADGEDLDAEDLEHMAAVMRRERADE